MQSYNIQNIVSNLEDNPLTLWNKGQLVVVPTETVYGLAADAANDTAVAQIYALKKRPKFNPLIAHMADIAMAKRYVVWCDEAEILARKFWPGALTLVLPLQSGAAISALATDGGDTLAIRVPNHPITRALIAAFDKPIVAPSANQSGRISPTKAAHVRAEFGDAVPLIIDGGACAIGVESTVLDLTGDAPVLLRAGGITANEIEAALGKSVLRAHQQNIAQKGAGTLRSPGMLTRHYAPNTKLRLNATEVMPDEALLAFGAPLPGAAIIFNLSESGDLVEAASRLFAGLRELDATGASAIAAMPIPNENIGEAINDRLTRAAVREQGSRIRG